MIRRMGVDRTTVKHTGAAEGVLENDPGVPKSGLKGAIIRRCRDVLRLRPSAAEKGMLAVAVPHFSVAILARGAGRSAVLSAAYRHCARMTFEREDRSVDYSRKPGLLHEEFTIPADAPAWLAEMTAGRPASSAAEAFWNRVEIFERRSDAQLARDFTIALPGELTAEQNIALMRAFVASQITAKGMVADWVYHDIPGNPHVHLMTTLRPLTEDGFGAKKVAVMGPDGAPIRNGAGKIVYELWAGNIEDFSALRDAWFACQNEHLALAGLDIRIDGRSYERQGIDLSPTIHLGTGATAIDRKARSAAQTNKAPAPELERVELQEERRSKNRRAIESNPAIVLDIVMRERCVFFERDIAKVLHRYVDEPELFRSLLVRIMQAPDVLQLKGAGIDFETGAPAPARYTTRAMIRLEADMARRSLKLAGAQSHGVKPPPVEAPTASGAPLTEEQRAALEHVLGPARISVVIGRAGAGKTTMMRAARLAWEAAGFRVIGGALAGKAADGLEKEAGIAARTLASWEQRWEAGRDRLDRRTIFVLDEAGMVSSRQMAGLVEAVTRSGGKLVLAGDPDQLQPIEAGAAFRAIADRIGYVELEGIMRQRQPWMRAASLELARGNVRAALDCYRANGKLIGRALKAAAAAQLIADWSRDYDPDKSSLILAQLRRDVRMLNGMARAELVARGVVSQGAPFETSEGERHFAAGDQIIFLRNDMSLGVRNGMLARVAGAGPGRITVLVGEAGSLRQIAVESRFYRDIDYGYATTIHKSQGATVESVKVLASLSLDRHLTYVAMTRHRADLVVYYGERAFAKAGGLAELLSRRNAKETTLDYEEGGSYRAALRFAEARGLRLLEVARMMVRARLLWTVQQKQKLVTLASRLSALGSQIAIARPADAREPIARENAPMVSGIKSFLQSFEQSVAGRLAAHQGLREHWREVTARFHLVYADPRTAFRTMNIDALTDDRPAAEQVLIEIASAPEAFGALCGKAGVLAGRGERQKRETALANAAALARGLDRFLRLRARAKAQCEADELAAREKAAIAIPKLSPAAARALAELGETLGRSEFRQPVNQIAGEVVAAELANFARVIGQRFGDRTFIGRAAADSSGDTFKALTAEMSAAQKSELRSAWSAIRAVQQLFAPPARQNSAVQRRAVGVTLK